MKEIYAWVPWFQELAGKIAEGGETYLAEAAKKVAWRHDGEQPPLLKHGDKNIDPFSFFYTVAQRIRGAGNRERMFRSIEQAFDMGYQLPVELLESDDAFIFPMPTYNSLVLFHNDGQGNPQLLWNLFRGAVRGIGSVAPEDFDGALDVGNVGQKKLTQALFLINPSQFLPCDGTMNSFVSPPAGKFRWQPYREWLQKALGCFPRCEPYEVNFFAYLSKPGKKPFLPVHSDVCFHVSTNVMDPSGGDHWRDFKPKLDFEPNHWVFTGGPGGRMGWEDYDESKDGPPKYPLRDPERGDVILVRTGISRGRGVGIVYKNDYRDRLAADSRIHVIWVNKTTTDKLSGHTEQKGFNRAVKGTLTAFRQAPAYSETLALLNRLSGREEATTSEWEAQEPEAKHSKNQILYGPPGTGKTYEAVNLALAIIDRTKDHERRAEDIERNHELRNSRQIAMVTFHQNYAYEDFIEGIRPELSKRVSGQVGYLLREGVFKQIAKAADAEEEEGKRFVLIIDEINRGNIAKIFGELITLIEGSRRLGAEDETRVTLPYSKEQFGVPNNLYLIGTMNTADRSIQLLDTALRRRFTFVEMMPEPEHKAISTDVEGVNCQRMLKVMNERITALIDREHQIGHTYLMGVDTMEKLSGAFQDNIFPLLQEYFFDDWSKIRAVLGRNSFVSEKEPPSSLADLEQADEERKIYERLPRGHSNWRVPEEYQKIYAVGNAEN